MIGTPQTRWREIHQSGRPHHPSMRSSPQPGIHCTCASPQRVAAQVVALHADEPLLGGPEDGRIVAAPAVRIAVLEILVSRAERRLLKQVDHDRVPLPDGLADQLVRETSRRAFGLEKPAITVYRVVIVNPVLLAGKKVFLAVTGAVWTAPVPVSSVT